MSIKRSLILLLLWSCSHSALKAQSCKIMFSIKNAGIEVIGIMNAREVEVRFDKYDLAKSFMIASASPVSINTGIGLRDKHLKKADYFHVEGFPEIKMESVKFTRQGNNEFTGDFNLTIKDITRQVRIPFTITRENGYSIYNGQFQMNRLDFKLGEESLLLDELVTVTITFNDYL
jgi:polyisoprenoid-binding protein YceI